MRILFFLSFLGSSQLASASEPTIAGYRIGMSLTEVQATGLAKSCSPDRSEGIVCSGVLKPGIGGASVVISFAVSNNKVLHIMAFAPASDSSKIREQFSREFGKPEIVPISSRSMNTAGATGAYRWVGEHDHLDLIKTDSMTFITLAPIGEELK